MAGRTIVVLVGGHGARTTAADLPGISAVIPNGGVEYSRVVSVHAE